MPVDKVHIHRSFLYGTHDSDIFKDLSTFDPQYNPDDALAITRITDFVHAVLNGNVLIGRNKYNTGDGYEANKAAHYHAGPYTCTINAVPANIRQHNEDGATSGPAIHYCWKGTENDIILLGYSPIKHQPFPKMRDKKNPLRARLKKTYQSNELISFHDIFNNTTS